MKSWCLREWFNSVAVCDEDCLPNAACFCCLAILLRMKATGSLTKCHSIMTVSFNVFWKCPGCNGQVFGGSFFCSHYIGLSALGQPENCCSSPVHNDHESFVGFFALEKALSSLSFLFLFLSSCRSLSTSGVRHGFFHAARRSDYPFA